MTRTLAIILAALLVAAGSVYLISIQSEPTGGSSVVAEESTMQGSQEVTGGESAAEQTQQIPYDEQWRNYLIGTWEWRDDGKDLIFVFGADNRFLYYEKEHADNPNASDDNAFGRWEILSADNFFAEVNLISINEEETEIHFLLEFIDDKSMGARTDDMPEDTYVLFERLGSGNEDSGSE